MPARKETAKKEAPVDKSLFLTIIVAIVIGVGLYFLMANFYPAYLQGVGGFGLPSKGISLTCSKTNDEQIKCSWKKCELGERNELVFAKVPDYVKSVEIPTESGSLLYSPTADPVNGLYTIYISCGNGKVATRVTM